MNEHFKKSSTNKEEPHKEQTKNDIPIYNPYTGEPNPYYEELTGIKNPLLESENNIVKFLQPSFEPKITNRYIVTLPPHFAIPEYCIAKTSRPKMRMVPKYFLGLRIGKKIEWENIVLELYDSIQPSVSESLMKIAEEWVDEDFNYNIEMCDPAGKVIEKWEIMNCSIISIEFGNLRYDSDNIIRCKMIIKPSDVKITN